MDELFCTVERLRPYLKLDLCYVNTLLQRKFSVCSVCSMYKVLRAVRPAYHYVTLVLALYLTAIVCSIFPQIYMRSLYWKMKYTNPSSIYTACVSWKAEFFTTCHSATFD